MSVLEEHWSDIPGYEGIYKASNFGNIRGLKRPGSSGGNLSPAVRKDGYLQVSLRKDGKARSLLVHRLVASAFLTKDDNKPFVNHLDGDRTNNNISNLEFCTCSENSLHRHYVLNKNVKPVVCIETGERYPSVRMAARVLGIGNKEISLCCRGVKRYKTAGGFHWKYEEDVDND